MAALLKHIESELSWHRESSGLVLFRLLCSIGSRHGTSDMRCSDGVGWLALLLGGGGAGLSEIISGCAIQEMRG